ncbi:MAG: hypothetical protein ACKOC4_11685 [Planctomycetia bacterium]
MTKVAVAEDVAAQIRDSDGPIELVDASGRTIGLVRRPPSEGEIERARRRAGSEGQRLSWAEVVAKVRDGAPE